MNKGVQKAQYRTPLCSPLGCLPFYWNDSGQLLFLHPQGLGQGSERGGRRGSGTRERGKRLELHVEPLVAPITHPGKAWRASALVSGVHCFRRWALRLLAALTRPGAGEETALETTTAAAPYRLLGTARTHRLPDPLPPSSCPSSSYFRSTLNPEANLTPPKTIDCSGKPVSRSGQYGRGPAPNGCRDEETDERAVPLQFPVYLGFSLKRDVALCEWLEKERFKSLQRSRRNLHLSQN